MAGKTLRHLAWPRLLLTIIFTCCVSVQLANSQTRTPKKSEATPEPTAQPSPVATPNPLAIATPQVAAEAIQLNQRLRSLPERLASNESLDQIEQQIEELKDVTGKRSRETELAIQSGAIFSDLQQSALDWQTLRKQTEELSETLTKQATALENEINSLKSEESRWQATNQEFRNQESPPEILDLTGKAVADLSAALSLIEARRGRVVALQQSITTQSSVIATEIDHLKKAIAQSQRSLLEPDSPALWKVQFGTHTEDSLARQLLRGSYGEDLTRVRAFISAKRTTLFVITVLAIVLLGLLLRNALTCFAAAPTASPGD